MAGEVELDHFLLFYVLCFFALEPQAASLTPPSGLELNCVVRETCIIPLYLESFAGPKPHVNPDMSSPGIRVSVSEPTPSQIPGTTLTAELSITPTEPGQHNVCVDISPGYHVCYKINSRGVRWRRRTPQNTGMGYHFLSSTLPDNSIIPCWKNRTCHILFETGKLLNGSCLPVVSTVFGVEEGTKYSLENTCLTDMKVIPDLISPNSLACMEVGPGGEVRCYQTFSVIAGACTSDSCVDDSHGRCIPQNINNVISHSCLCRVPYKGGDCSEVGYCPTVRCVNNGVCVNKTGGFECKCLPGYNGDDCQHEPSPCSNSACKDGSVCLEESGAAVCKCPLDKEGDECNTTNTDTPVPGTYDPKKPHFALPSPANGMEINCYVGQPCQIPVYVKDGTGVTPQVLPGPTSPDIKMDIGHPESSPAVPDRHMITMTVVPQAPGEHHVCVSVPADSSQNNTVCYRINTPPGPAEPPYTGNWKFTDGTPSNGSTINCFTGTPCHLIVQTAKPSGGCKPARPQTVGVLVFPLPESGGTCNTDVRIEPDIVSGTACVDAGFGGEIRCYKVNLISDDKCILNPCMNGGECINAPEASPQYKCACPPPYAGENCQEANTDTPVPVTHDQAKPSGQSGWSTHNRRDNNDSAWGPYVILGSTLSALMMLGILSLIALAVLCCCPPSTWAKRQQEEEDKEKQRRKEILRGFNRRTYHGGRQNRDTDLAFV